MDNSNLVQLIRVLNKSEKRYIVLYLSKHIEDNKLLHLFKVISDNSSVKSANISGKIKDKKILARLHQYTFDLYQLLIDALHRFDLKKSPYARILTMLHQSEILLHKGLYEARKELLLKAGQLADEYELEVLKLEVIRLQNTGVASKDHLKETKQLTSKIIEHAEVNQLNNKMLAFQNRVGERLTLLQRKYAGKLLSTFKKKKLAQDSFYPKYAHISFLMKYYRSSGDDYQAYANNIKIIKLFKQYPQMLRLQQWRFLYCDKLIDLIAAANRVYKNDTSEMAYNEIMKLDVSTIYKSNATINMLDFYVRTGEFKKGEHILNDVQRHPPKTLRPVNTLILYSNLAYMNFGLGNYSKALFWLNEIINMPREKIAGFPYLGIMLMIRLVTYYELKQFDLLENKVSTTSNYIEKQRDKFKMDQLIMEYLLKMIAIQDKTELKKVMEEARNKLLQLTKIKSEARTLELFDFISWLESKIENRSFVEVVREKARKRLVIGQ